MEQNRKHITGIILAGGKSSRMGTDKGLLKFKKFSFIEHIIMAMKPLVNHLVIISDNPRYDEFGIERVEDIIKGKGPLAGLYTGLNYSKTDLNLVLSCDVPLVKSELLATLIQKKYSNTDIVQFKTGNHTFPLIATYRKNCEKTCIRLLEKGEKRLMALQKYHKTFSIEISDKFKPQIINVNTPDELKTIDHEPYN
ncbi:MAG: molybdenum cofactor guanylyltransferase [Flavobacteriaceae bacterium]|nr:molybdenum cofactor guanylyltransferase [Flavobacteriaceae bacterium]